MGDLFGDLYKINAMPTQNGWPNDLNIGIIKRTDKNYEQKYFGEAFQFIYHN